MLMFFTVVIMALALDLVALAVTKVLVLHYPKIGEMLVAIRIRVDLAEHRWLRGETRFPWDYEDPHD